MAIEEIKQKVHETILNPSSLRVRYVDDDVYVIVQGIVGPNLTHFMII